EAARAALAASRTAVAATASGEPFSSRLAAARDTSSKGATPKSFQRFEAMVLQTFIQNMMPKNTESVYGSGMAGDIWKSLMAEQLAASMAERGGIGIASRLLRDHYVEGDAKLPIGAVSDPQVHAEVDQQRLLSTALVDEIQRQIARGLSEDATALAAPETKD
ncbi:MAG: rod-binding protein, partial [Rhizobiaceae bacterium]|nr:rod-binding protein [Rhizobiaceae bacterium]